VDAAVETDARRVGVDFLALSNVQPCCCCSLQLFGRTSSWAQLGELTRLGRPFTSTGGDRTSGWERSNDARVGVIVLGVDCDSCPERPVRDGLAVEQAPDPGNRLAAGDADEEAPRETAVMVGA
jgi:hypothetical protein